MLYEVVLDSRYAGQQCINRWNYLSTGSTSSVSGSFALLSAMGFVGGNPPPVYPSDGIFTAIRNLQVSAVTYVEVVAKAIYDVLDFYTLPYIAGEAGLNVSTGDATPISAYGFKTNRVRQDIGRGYKRFAGVANSQLNNFGDLAANAEALTLALSELMSDTLTYDDEGSVVSFVPVVVSKEKYTAPSGKDAYRYYATESVQESHLAQGITWQPYPEVRSQNSRQYGKGS